jgi:hypothetical protein
MRRILRENSLGMVFGLLFLGSLFGQALSGLAQFNDQQLTDGLAEVGMGRYLTSSSFAVDVVENWQSEYLQFFLYIFGTVWLIQRGSPESKHADQAGTESDEDQRIGRHARSDSPAWARVGAWRTLVLSRSLGLVMGLIFFACWAVQSIAGWAAYNAEQLGQRQDLASAGPELNRSTAAKYPLCTGCESRYFALACCG